MSERKWIEEQVETAVQTIRAELREPSGKKLSITGLEPILIDLGTKIVVGVITGLVSKTLFERWGSAKTKDEIEKLKTEIVALKTQLQPVDSTLIQTAIQARVAAQGVPDEPARRIAVQVIADVRAVMLRSP